MTDTPNKPKPARRAPATKARAARAEAPKISPALLAEACTRDRPVTSMDFATANPVGGHEYTRAERAAAKHAMDFNLNTRDALSFVDATGFPGFPALALLAQLPEYRAMHETLADEVVRTWGHIGNKSKDPAAAAKVVKLEQALERLNVRAVVRKAVVQDQAFGGTHVLPRLLINGQEPDTDTPLILSPKFVPLDSLDSLAVIEPIWVTPNNYNSTDPTKPNFYKPNTWVMLSRTVHATRMHTLISRPVADMLKPAYSFRGLSMSQMAMPYVDNWLRTRQSVSDTVKQFSVTFLGVDMAQMLAPGGQTSLMHRAQLFNAMRDNRNIGLIDKETEEFGQINTPLSGLDALQAQSQEQLSAVSHIPLVKLTGVTPAGLNANSDGEIRVWYDYVAGFQSNAVGPLMQYVLALVQLSTLGEIDPGLSWEWNPLHELTDLELADMRDKQSATDLRYVEIGAVTPEQVQERLGADPNSGYAGLLSDQSDTDEIREHAENALREALAPTPAPVAPAPDPKDDTDGADSDKPDAPAAPGR